MTNRSITLSFYICILVSIIARLTNFGWGTIFTSVIVIPMFLIHAFLQKSITDRKCGNNKPIANLSVISNMLFLLSSILMPDGNDTGNQYAIFGLITNPPKSLDNVATIIFGLAMILSVFVYFISKYSHNKQINQDK
jgi:predicted transporter